MSPEEAAANGYAWSTEEFEAPRTYYRVWCRDQGRTEELDSFDTAAAAKAYIKEIEAYPHRYDLACPSFSITTALTNA